MEENHKRNLALDTQGNSKQRAQALGGEGSSGRPDHRVQGKEAWKLSLQK